MDGFLIFICFLVVGLLAARADQGLADRRVVIRTRIKATPEQLWQDWTTADGLKSFLEQEASIQMQPRGRFELAGAEGTRLLAMEPARMLSVEWANPADMTAIHQQHTHLTVYFEPAPNGDTKLTLVQNGFGLSPDWDAALAHFKREWPQALSRLADKYRP